MVQLYYVLFSVCFAGCKENICPDQPNPGLEITCPDLMDAVCHFSSKGKTTVLDIVYIVY